MTRTLSRGDTLVEMVLAFAIFSVAGVAAIAIMNRGLSLSQHSLETTLVRQQMDGQAEIIRYLRDTADPLWTTIKDHAANTKVATLSPSTCPRATDIAAVGSGRNGFFIARDESTGAFLVHDIDATNFTQPATYARIDASTHTAFGLWVQTAKAENQGGHAIDAYDMYIHACWDSVALKNAPATLGTIVRIYDK